jgi:hypothetical protein
VSSETIKNSNFARGKVKKLITKVTSAGCLPFTLSGHSRGETIFSSSNDMQGVAGKDVQLKVANAEAMARLRRRVAEGSPDCGGGAR